MADTIKQKILDNIKAALDAVVILNGNALINNPDELDLEIAPLPQAFIDSNTEDESPEERDTGHEAFVWRPAVSVYFRVQDPANNREPEKFLGAIHAALTQDRSRGGYADETKRLTADIIDLDAHSGLVQGVFTLWEISYTHIQNDPYSQ